MLHSTAGARSRVPATPGRPPHDSLDGEDHLAGFVELISDVVGSTMFPFLSGCAIRQVNLVFRLRAVRERA